MGCIIRHDETWWLLDPWWVVERPLWETEIDGGARFPSALGGDPREEKMG